MADTVLNHGIEQVFGFEEIVLVILYGYDYRLPHLDKRGEVHRGINLCSIKKAVQLFQILQIPLDKLTCDYRITIAFRQVIESYDVMPRSTQQLDHVRTDITSTTDDENIHFQSIKCQLICCSESAALLATSDPGLARSSAFFRYTAAFLASPFLR